MMRTPMRWFIQLGLVALTLAGAGCGDAGGGGAGGSGGGRVPLPVTIGSQDAIVSEDGELELLTGRLQVVSISLIGEEGNVQLLGATTLDLSLELQEVQLSSPVKPGSYTGLEVELAPAAEGGLMLDSELRSITTGETIRAITELAISGATKFPEGARAVTEESTVELSLSLRGMFFYLSPTTGAVDGVYEVGESQEGFLTMDLIGMFDLRVLP